MGETVSDLGKWEVTVHSENGAWLVFGSTNLFIDAICGRVGNFSKTLSRQGRVVLIEVV